MFSHLFWIEMHEKGDPESWIALFQTVGNSNTVPPV
jgi:hypothetical protein